MVHTLFFVCFVLLIVTLAFLCGAAGTSLKLVRRGVTKTEEFVQTLLVRSSVNESLVFKGADYAATIELGTPRQALQVLFDSGSPLLWVYDRNRCIVTSSVSGVNTFLSRNVCPNSLGSCPASRGYSRTASSSSHLPFDQQRVSITFGSGAVGGILVNDVAAFQSNEIPVPINFLDVLCASRGIATGIGPEQSGGLIGASPAGVTSSNFSLVQNLFSSHQLNSRLFGLWLGLEDGEVTFGCVDRRRFTGTISYIPLEFLDELDFWAFPVDRMLVGNSNACGNSGCGVGIIDSGTTAIVLTSQLFTAFQRAIPGWNGVSTFLCSQLELMNLPTLSFGIGGNIYEVVPNAYVAQISPTRCVLLVTPASPQSLPTNIHIVLGDVFLRPFYAVHDIDSRRIGFAHSVGSIDGAIIHNAYSSPAARSTNQTTTMFCAVTNASKRRANSFLQRTSPREC